MRLNQQLVFALRFAQFSTALGIPPEAVAQMIAHARASAKCYERGDDAGEQKHGGEVEAIADKHGCRVEWAGLIPSVNRKGDPTTRQMLPTD